MVVLFKLGFFLVGFLFWFGWLGWLGLKFLFENCQVLQQCFQLVGWVGWVIGFLSWSFFPVSSLSSWFAVSGWLVGFVGVEVFL